MARTQKISLKHSVEAVKELYLIIVGLGLTQTLWDLAPALKDFFEKPALTIFYIVALSGYLSVVFQFTLGTFNVLTSVAEHANSKDNEWTKSIAGTSLCFILSAIFIVLMGKHIKGIDYYEYCIFLVLLFAADIFGLVGSHRPWDKQKHFQNLNIYWDWFITKSLYLMFLGINSNYQKYYNFYKTKNYLLTDPAEDPEYIRSPDDRAIKETHYWWCSANVWVIFYILLGSLILILINTFLPSNFNEFLFRPIAEKPLHQYLSFLFLSIVLLITGHFNFSMNSIYFFGKSSKDKQSKPFEGLAEGLFTFLAVSIVKLPKQIISFFKK